MTEHLSPEELTPVAWMTRESARRLADGGNDSRGSVPVHAKRSNVACIPLYTEEALRAAVLKAPMRVSCATAIKAMQREIDSLRGFS
jgi:hypothetical protein